MPLKPIECANCGAKYRLPETFKADHAKCKKCGAQIDVAAQRSAPAATAPKVAPSATPVEKGQDAEAAPVKAPTRSSSRRGSTSSRRRKSADHEDGAEIEAPRSRRSRSRSSRKSGPSPMIFVGIVGVLAVVLVVLVFVLSGDEPAAEDTASNEPESATPAEATDADRLTAMRGALDGLPDADRSVLEKYLDAAQRGTVGPAEELADVSAASMLTFASKSLEIAGVDDEASRLAEMAKNPEVDADQLQAVAAVVSHLADSGTEVDSTALASMLSAVGPATAEPAAAKKQPEKTAKKELKTAADIFNPMTALEPLEWQEFVTEEEKTEVTEALAAIRDGGLHGIKAKTRLEEMGASALVGIINQLRELDYTNDEDSVFAYELHRLISAISKGKFNADFQTVNLGEEIALDKANHNAITVRVWQQFFEKYNTQEALDAIKVGK